ncbi:MAG: LPS export ABC transporter periplasmic protein LptC [Bacteroidota bacterium]|nr:LPS export ABC transporter periplasmic protein LptC [Bacteroidota bacterium]|tara:strand:- start:692 stop:1225 length:534 start_codon:yes stop_codon:yes gene_type:complete
MRLFYLAVVFFYSCSNDPQLITEFIAKEDLPIEQIEHSEILHTEKGILKIKIIANTINRFKDIQPQLVFSNGIQVIFYNDSGLVNSVLKAVNAEINEDDNIMIVSEDVVLTSSEGKKIETEELIWDKNRNKIYTNRKVVITTKKEVIEGEGFESNPDFSQYLISKIHGIFNFDPLTN